MHDRWQWQLGDSAANLRTANGISSNTRIAALGVPSATIAAIIDANGAINLFTRTKLNGSWAQAIITPDNTAIPKGSLAFVPNNEEAIVLAFVDAAGKVLACTRVGIETNGKFKR